MGESLKDYLLQFSGEATNGLMDVNLLSVIRSWDIDSRTLNAIVRNVRSEFRDQYGWSYSYNATVFDFVEILARGPQELEAWRNVGVTTVGNIVRASYQNGMFDSISFALPWYEKYLTSLCSSR